MEAVLETKFNRKRIATKMCKINKGILYNIFYSSTVYRNAPLTYTSIHYTQQMGQNHHYI